MLAVMRVEALMPNVTPFESTNASVPEVAVCVPAASAPGAVLCEYDADAVTVDPLRPKLTLFAFDQTTVPAPTLAVPALIAAGPVDCE
jgi:hypothetical protein